MKKVLPFVFPLIALGIVIFLAYRWYNLNTATKPEIGEVGEGVKIEDLTEAERLDVLRGVGDFKQKELAPDGEVEGRANVRYELKDDKVRFSVTAELPELTAGHYQVWVKPTIGETQKAFRLEMNKAGYIGSAALSQTVLPFEVIVSQEMSDDNQLEKVLFKAQLEKEGS